MHSQQSRRERTLRALTAAVLATTCAAGAGAALAHAAGAATTGHPTTTKHPTTTTRRKGSAPPRRVIGVTDRLVLSYAVDPTSVTPGQTVTFTVTVREAAPRGAVGYHLQFGDGSVSQNSPAKSCRAAPGPGKQQTWTLHHDYSNTGVYHATVLAQASCSGLHITHTINVTVSNG